MYLICGTAIKREGDTVEPPVLRSQILRFILIYQK